MENLTTTLPNYMYNQYDYNKVTDLNNFDVKNKLFCTFTSLDNLENLINIVSKSYDILYNKIFILYVKSNNEYALTYNIEVGNIDFIPENTIMVHRKKDTNTLYTINAINQLIKTLNNNIIDMKYPINWNNYKSCILLTQQGEFKQLNTRVFKIVNL